MIQDGDQRTTVTIQNESKWLAWWVKLRGHGYQEL